MIEDFKWYEILNEEEEITQGDILINFPFLRCNNYNDLLNNNSHNIEVCIEKIDCIILTQSCDIKQSKQYLENIILCPIIDLDTLDFSKSKLGELLSGKLPQFYMLNKCENFKNEYMENGFNYHIVNFNVIEKAPVAAIKEFAKYSKQRLRLLPPYREHLSQAFAKYFMRIGLPSDIDKNEVYKAKDFL